MTQKLIEIGVIGKGMSYLKKHSIIKNVEEKNIKHTNQKMDFKDNEIKGNS